TFSLSLGCAPDFALTGRRVPEALLFNVAPIYENLKWIYEQGRRRVAINGQSIEVASGCGQPWQWETAGRIKVDDAFEIVSPQPLRAAYLAAKGPERGRVTDRLILNYLPGNHTWATGAVISDYQAAIRCSRTDASR
ncbi:MAG TPA: hypothetical protein P5534_22185, partial [Candidatus Paceibacterota bacterium]|nr:hypothetical protein [Candidatus Paceibacterota bacterium]